MENVFYFAQVFQGINVAATIIFVFLTGTAIGLFIETAVMKYEDEPEKADKYFKSGIKTTIIACIVLLLSIFVPTKRTYLFMKAGKVVDEAVEVNPEISELPQNTLLLLNEYIKAETAELQERKTEEQ